MKPNILITGGNGQLGTSLAKLLPHAVVTDKDQLDITQEKAVRDFVHQHRIDTIINCAAYTAVDEAESDIERATRINVTGPANLAKTGCKLIHISTDYVFAGNACRPYTPQDEPNPLSIYGKTKRAGELAVLQNAAPTIIIRTAWLYSTCGHNFVKTIKRLGQERDTLRVVCDQIGTPTHADSLARAMVQILPQMNAQTAGIYHYTDEGVCSWYDFACEIIEQSALNCRVIPIPSAAYPTPAPRPFYSVLDKSKIKDTFGIQIQHWKKELAACLKQF